jgi:hypothetical protein
LRKRWRTNGYRSCLGLLIIDLLSPSQTFLFALRRDRVKQGS